jgi:hypothetical protein
MNCLSSLDRCNRGFESYSRYGCLYCVRLFCVCVVLCAGVLKTVYKIKTLKKQPRPNKCCRARIIVMFDVISETEREKEREERNEIKETAR